MDISVTFKGGESIVKLKPVFSISGENIFVASKDTILQYNTTTGKLVYEYKGWGSDIVGLNCNMIDNLECIAACSKCGKLIVWKIVKRIKLFEVQLPHSSVLSFNLISQNFAKGLNILISCYAKKKKIAFLIINTKNPDKGKFVLKIRRNKFAVDVCQNKYFAAVVKNTIDFVNLETFKTSSHSMAKNNRIFTCVACHPEEEIVLTGDNTGRIVLWQNIFGRKTQAVFHWHTLPVQCMAFSTLGSYFYSGANECVLVKWQMNDPHQKRFLPRLPAGIAQLTVSHDNAYVAVATLDNAVRIVDPQMNDISLIQRLVLGYQFECGIIYDPITRALVMNGHIGCVQFFSPSDMSLLYNIDIVNQNKVTEERNCKIENTDVKKIALSTSGTWLATVEERKELDACKELRLKFWFFNSEKQTYELNTSIEFPHESSVNSIAIQPLGMEDNLKCVTLGNDRTFKIWQVVEVASVHGSGPIWKCTNMGTFRNMACRALSFSTDGSLFAIAFGPILTLWASDNCELKSSLLHSNFKESIKFIQFGQGNQCHLIATAGKTLLSVWNILTLTMSWIVNLSQVNLLVSDPLSSYMLLICRGNIDGNKRSYKVIVFEPSSPSILFASTDLIQTSEKIVAAAFVPSIYSNDTRLQWYERAHLYFITASSELYCISKREGTLYEDTEDNTEDLSEEISVFTKMKPRVQTSQVTHSAKHHMFPKDMVYKSYRQYLEAPIATLPPIRLLASSLLKSLVLQREIVQDSQEDHTF